ncbi:MAG: hypothetical protein ACI9IL_000752 [Rickettsiales bacterium]|jgi:hypothetical protein
MYKEGAQDDMTISTIPISKNLEIRGNYGTDDLELIPKYAKKRII